MSCSPHSSLNFLSNKLKTITRCFKNTLKNFVLLTATLAQHSVSLRCHIGKNVTLWDDISIIFRNATRAHHGVTSIPFLTNNSLEFLRPLRINIYPKVILEVVNESPITVTGENSNILTADTIHQGPNEALRSSLSTLTVGASQSTSTNRTTHDVRRYSVGVPLSYAVVIRGQKQIISNAARNIDATTLWIYLCYDSAEINRLIKSANQEDISYQCELGGRFRKGNGVEINYLEAASWYGRASDQGNSTAQLHLGNMYHGGKGVSNDHSKAAEWITISAMNGNKHSQYTTMVKGLNKITTERSIGTRWLPHKENTDLWLT
ncbi:hypothetical protein BGZ49_000914 [Haplosporangium sp. Z 27]|nr:hypothetical protein BGZ49_000914 [Haplosporangium sp. Z 27]